MRMRRKPNLEKRLGKCASVLIAEPASLRGDWLKALPDYRALEVELGCGKGRFTADRAEEAPDVLLVAVERDPSALVMAMERILARGIGNVRFICGNVDMLCECFAPDEVSGIFLNFCDPWPKSRDAKLRLTAPGFLRRYASVLPAGGELRFKTDNAPLFDWSLLQLASEGWTVRDATHDLHEKGITGILTDYEARFLEQGMKICRLTAVREAGTKSTSDGEPARLRDASLSDARANTQPTLIKEK